MEQEKLTRVLQSIDSELVHNYHRGKNQVMLQIDAKMFNQLAEELHN
jgi:hypothetical protein